MKNAGRREKRTAIVPTLTSRNAMMRYNAPSLMLL